ncbi:MAG: ROK family protein [Verrucomicrobia bacterium]|nr:ROK family protein [Verrucomicrobiota bacterium]
MKSPLALAFDLGGSHTDCALVNAERVLATRTLPCDARAGLAPLLPDFADAARTVCAEAGVNFKELAGCVMGLPCVVEPGTNRVRKTFGKYDDTATLDLAGWCRATLDGLPLATENDARLALLGEWSCGAARGFDDAVMLTLGTGIGGAAMMGGRLVTSKHALAGANGGHFTVNMHGRRCICGNIGCAETEAATWSLPLVIADFAARRPELAQTSTLLLDATTTPDSTDVRLRKIDFRRVFAAARAGDGLAVAVRDHCVRAWAFCAVSNAQAYDAEVIVLGGGVMQSAQDILPPVEAHVHLHAFSPWGKIAVRAAALGNHAALLGAVPLLRSVGIGRE